MTGTLTGHMYGKLVNATYLELIVGGWLELSEETAVNADLAETIFNRPSWV